MNTLEETVADALEDSGLMGECTLEKAEALIRVLARKGYEIRKIESVE